MSVELCQNERRGQMCADVGVIILAEGASRAKAPVCDGLKLVIQEPKKSRCDGSRGVGDMAFGDSEPCEPRKKSAFCPNTMESL